MEIRYLINVIRAHLPFLVLSTLVAGAVAVLATYVLPEKYEASTLILIRPQQEPNFAPTAETKATLDYPVSFNIPPESVSLTYANIMTSPAVAKRVVEILALDRATAPGDLPIYTRTYRFLRNAARRTIGIAWDLARYGRVERKDPYWKAVEDVTEGLKASPVEDTFLFRLTATWEDPELAALIADTAARVFIEYTLDARRAEESASVVTMTGRLDRLKAQLDDARNRLRDFETQNQSAVPSRRLELKLDALTEFESLREQVERELTGTDARIGSLEGLVEGEPVDVQTSSTLARNDFLEGIRTELASDERKLAELEQTMTPAHPEVKALRARIAASSKRIAEEQEMTHLRDESARNPVREGLRKDLLDGRAMRESLEATRRDLAGSIAVYRNDIDELVRRKSEQERLALEVSVLEEEYKFVSREHAEALLAAAQELSEIRALAPAIPPVYPERPIKILYAGIGLLSGFLAALGLVLATDYAEPRVRTSEDVRRLVAVPIIVTSQGAAKKLKSEQVLADRTSPPLEVWRLLAAETNGEAGRHER
jgi:uncharacterized protein involved in exopolysaccharide biosynthesis